MRKLTIEGWDHFELGRDVRLTSHGEFVDVVHMKPEMQFEVDPSVEKLQVQVDSFFTNEIQLPNQSSISLRIIEREGVKYRGEYAVHSISNDTKAVILLYVILRYLFRLKNGRDLTSGYAIDAANPLLELSVLEST